MSDYQARCATNPFRVKNIQDLKDSLECEGFTVITRGEDFGQGLDAVLVDVCDESAREVALFADGEHGMWPDLYDYVTEEEAGGLPGVTEAVVANLQDDAVAVFTEVGADAWDLTGHTVAVNARGEALEIWLGDIAEVASAQFGLPVRA